jgi:hypothetical protein
MNKLPIKYQLLITFIAWAIWVIMILTNTSMLSEIQILNNLKNHGVEFEAEVIKATSNWQSLSYSYTINGKQYTGGGEKGAMKYPEKWPQVGSKIKITYDVTNPEVSKYGPVEDNLQSELISLFFILVVAPSVIIISFYIRQRHILRKRALTRRSS